MGKRIHIALFCLLLANSGKAQYHELMRSLRPGQAVNPWTVGESIFQIHAGGETGWSAGSDERVVYYNRYHAGNATLCYGVLHKLEIDAAIGVRQDNAEYNNVKAPAAGLNLAALGARWNILDGGERGLSLGLQGLIKIPGLSKEYETARYAPRILALFGYDPSNVISLTANLGIDYDGVTNHAIGLYALKASFLMSNRLGSFIETYGNFRYGQVYNHIDGGLFLYITRNLQIDASAGFGAVASKDEGFIGAGITWRFSTVRNRSRWIYGNYR